MKIKIAIISAVILFSTTIIGSYDYLNRSYVEENTIIYVQPGDSFLGVLRGIETSKRHFVKPIIAFYLKVKHLSPTLKTGEFKIPDESSLFEIIDILSLGKNRLYHAITFPEGFTNFQIMERIKGIDLFCGEIPHRKLTEGLFYPETYHIERCSTHEELLQRMQKKQNEVLNKLWEKRDVHLPYKSKKEALILASMVEKEARIAEERPLIAGVMINRINKRMYLNIDATIIYAMLLKDPFREIKRLTYKDLKLDSPYNTYRKRGLPPTPISNPGFDSLQAGFFPKKTDFLYYVFDPIEKKHIFSKSLKEHNINRKQIKQKTKLSAIN